MNYIQHEEGTNPCNKLSQVTKGRPTASCDATSKQSQPGNGRTSLTHGVADVPRCTVLYQIVLWFTARSLLSYPVLIPTALYSYSTCIFRSDQQF